MVDGRGLHGMRERQARPNRQSRQSPSFRSFASIRVVSSAYPSSLGWKPSMTILFRVAVPRALYEADALIR